jgi:hypothetical protein
MPYTLMITEKPAYLHAIVTGTNTTEVMARYLEELLRECTIRRCRRLLIEERLEGPRIGTLDVFKLASEISARARGAFEAIAYVDVNADNDVNTRFAETVVVNRGLPARAFSSVADAEQWLDGHDPTRS